MPERDAAERLMVGDAGRGGVESRVCAKRCVAPRPHRAFCDPAFGTTRVWRTEPHSDYKPPKAGGGGRDARWWFGTP